MIMPESAKLKMTTQSSKISKCQNCKKDFSIYPENFQFYEKMQVPAPTFCPECRFTRRLLWRNERSLYKRVCDLCGKEKIMMFPKESLYKVYCKECWWSDAWDAQSFSLDYNFSEPFFDQFDTLLRRVPRPGIIQQGTNVASEYSNRASNNKNVYLLFGSNFNEDCLYGSWVNDSRDSLDNYNLQKSELCYECIDCVGCYNLRYSQECNTCSQSAFLFNCRNCDYCFGCVNLRSKSYCIFNKQYTKEEYQKALAKWDLGQVSIIQECKTKFLKERYSYIVPWTAQHKSSKVSGNWLEVCKNVFNSFNCRDVEDSEYAFALVEANDTMDYSFWGRGCELIYESINIGYQCSQVSFANECWNEAIDLRYSMNCHNSGHLFGCVGLRNKKYCIFNKQYTSEDYERLLPKIIEHMKEMPYQDKKRRVHAYGEFFPAELSLFAYNETVAQEYFPLTKEKALEQGYVWKEEEQKQREITIRYSQLPDAIHKANETILKETIGCEHEGKCNEQCTTTFRIIPQELKFYQNANLPLPRLCPNCRHYQRLGHRNPLRLWRRICQCTGNKSENEVYQNTAQHFHKSERCPNEFQTSYAPDRPEIVYCEQCYLAEVA